MSKSKFIYTLSESKNTSALEQNVIVVSFVKNVAFLLGHPVQSIYPEAEPKLKFYLSFAISLQFLYVVSYTRFLVEQKLFIYQQNTYLRLGMIKRCDQINYYTVQPTAPS